MYIKTSNIKHKILFLLLIFTHTPWKAEIVITTYGVWAYRSSISMGTRKNTFDNEVPREIFKICHWIQMSTLCMHLPCQRDHPWLVWNGLVYDLQLTYFCIFRVKVVRTVKKCEWMPSLRRSQSLQFFKAHWHPWLGQKVPSLLWHIEARVQTYRECGLHNVTWSRLRSISLGLKYQSQRSGSWWQPVN